MNRLNVAISYMEAEVVKPHHAVNETELDLQVGDRVCILECNELGRCGGHKHDEEKLGWFSSQCVEIYSRFSIDSSWPAPLSPAETIHEDDLISTSTVFTASTDIQVNAFSAASLAEARAEEILHRAHELANLRQEHGSAHSYMAAVIEEKEREVEAERSKKCSALAERATLLKQLQGVQARHQEVEQNQTVLRKSLERKDIQLLRCTGVGCTVENHAQEESEPAQSPSHRGKPAMPQQNDCHNSSNNWHAGAVKNSLKAKSSVKSAHTPLFESSTSPCLTSTGEGTPQFLSRCVHAGFNTPHTRQIMPDSKPKCAPHRKNMLSRHSSVERIPQELCTKIASCGDSNEFGMSSIKKKVSSVVPSPWSSPPKQRFGQHNSNNAAPIVSQTVHRESRKLVEPHSPIVSVRERIRRFEPRSGGR